MDCSKHTRPLSYSGLKCVLQYMSADKRFSIAQQCPSIRTAERKTHLKIDSLGLCSPFELCVNTTRYEIELNEKTDNINRWLKADPYGHQTYQALQYVEIPGEVSIPFKLGSPRSFETIEDRVKKVLKDIKEKSSSDKNLGGSLYEYFQRSPSNPMVQYLVYKRLNKRFPLDLYIRMTVSNGNRSRIEEVLYDVRTCYDAMKYLYFKFFTGRKSVSVNSLTIRLHGPFRFPSNVNIRTPHIKIIWRSPQDLTSIERLIDFPKLKSIEFSGDFQEGSYDHPFILKVPQMIQNDDISLTDVSVFHHKKVLFTCHHVKKSKIMEFVEKWKTDGMPIGSLYSFRIWKTLDMSAWFQEWKTLYDADVAMDSSLSNLPNRLIIPLDLTLKIHVYCVQEPIGSWLLNLEVL